MASYKHAFPYNIELVIPGYERSYPISTFRTGAFTRRTSEEWYREFTAQLEDAIGRRYLPVCRMSDGEFQFALGGPRDSLQGPDETRSGYLLRIGRSWFGRFRRMVARAVRLGRLAGGFREDGDSTIPSGVYTAADWPVLRSRYAEQLREIAMCGLLCMHFSYRRTQFAQQYIVPMLRLMAHHKIPLTDANYYPFYFVYALLNGPDRGRLLGRERILVVTHCDAAKAARIERTLRTEGARDVQFLQISQNQSMFDTLNLTRVTLPVDLVLVGAGIGKTNILLQLRETRTLCIDAGFVIECLADPQHRRSRAGARSFCWADFERQGDFTPL